LEDEASLATRAAWLHYVGGLTQSAVAARLNVPRIKAHRLIARAARDGMVRVFVDGRAAECVALETALIERWGLERCTVTPDLGEDGLPLRALGAAGASFLRAVLDGEPDALVGVGHGRTLAAAADRLPRLHAPAARFVSLLGGLTRGSAANPYDVVHRLVERTGAEGYVMPAPFVADSEGDRATLLAQSAVREVVALAGKARRLVVGVGAVGDGSFLRCSGMLDGATLDDLRRAGAVGEVLGHALDANGRLVETELERRVVSLPFPALSGRKATAIAGGRAKARAIAAVLASGVLSGLVIDEPTARAVLAGRAP
jgi:DNA-binding transcriptional regulator LsrR (DeoR family)